MGQMYRYRCNQCQHDFEFTEGPIYPGYLLHCDTCGKEKLLDRNELPPELIKALVSQQPQSGSTETIEPCQCGGRFIENVEPRCPKCRATDLTEDLNWICMVD